MFENITLSDAWEANIRKILPHTKKPPLNIAVYKDNLHVWLFLQLLLQNHPQYAYKACLQFIGFHKQMIPFI
jgi:hypothetical protein